MKTSSMWPKCAELAFSILNIPSKLGVNILFLASSVSYMTVQLSDQNVAG